MRDKRTESLMRLQRNTPAVGAMREPASNGAPDNRVRIPEYWKKKKLNPKFMKQLKATANREAVMSDEFGEYKDGVFLHGCAVVVVSITNGLWSLEIHSEHAVGLPMIREIRQKYIPDAFLMAQLFPSRKEVGNVIVLYHIPDSFVNGDKKETEAPHEALGE